jgi:hypothetical protein
MPRLRCVEDDASRADLDAEIEQEIVERFYCTDEWWPDAIDRLPDGVRSRLFDIGALSPA